MPRKDDLIIQISTEFKDNSSNQLKRAMSNFDKATESVEEFDKKLKTVGMSDAEPVLSLKDKATEKLEVAQDQLDTVDNEVVEATVTANDKASNIISSVLGLGNALDRMIFNPNIGAVDKATGVIENIEAYGKSLTSKAWNMTVSVVDKATEPLRNAYNWATSLQGIVTGIAAGTAAKSLIGEPIDIADFYTQSQIGFETMLGSAEKAQQMMNDINQFAVATPFEARGLTDISQKMLAMGWSAERIIPDLETIGNTMSAFGKGEEGIQAVTLALSQMQANGKVNAGDMMQLTNQGISAWQYLADSVGKTVGETREMASQGLIPANDAVNAILNGMKQFDGMMEKTATMTVEGLLSQLEEAATVNLFKPWGEGLQQGVLPGLSKINDLMNDTLMGSMNMGDKLKELGQTLGSTVMDSVADVAERLAGVLNDPQFNSASFADKVLMLLDKGVAEPIASWWRTGGEAQVTKIATSAMKTIGNVAAEMLPVVIKSAFSNPITASMATSWGVKTASNMLGGMISGITGAKKVFSNTKDMLSGLTNIKSVGWSGFKTAVNDAGSLSGALKTLAKNSKDTGSTISSLSKNAGDMVGTFKVAYQTTGSFTQALAQVKSQGGGLSSLLGSFGGSSGGFLSSLASMGPAILGVTAVVGAGAAIYHNYSNAVAEANERQAENIEKNNQLIQSSQSLSDQMNAGIESRRMAIDSAAAEGVVATDLANRLFAVKDANDQSAGSYAQVKAMVDSLNETMPQLNLSYDESTNQLYDQNGALIENRDALLGRIDALQQEAIAEAARESMTEAYKEQASAIAQLNQLTPELNQKYTELQAAYQRYNETKPGTSDYYTEMENVKLVSDQYNGLRSQVDTLSQTYENSKASIQSYSDIYSQAMNGTYQTTVTTVEENKAKLDELPAKASEVGPSVGANYVAGVNSEQENARQAGENLGNQTAAGTQAVDMNSKGNSSGINWIEGFKSAASGISSWWDSVISGMSANISKIKPAQSAATGSSTMGEAPKVQDKHAEGGIMDTPHVGLVAEDGPEAIIPLGDKRRSKGIKLWQEAGKRLGVYTHAEGGISSGSAPAESSTPQEAGNIQVDIVPNVQSGYGETLVNEFQSTVGTSLVPIANQAYSALGSVVSGKETELTTNLSLIDSNYLGTYQNYLIQVQNAGTSAYTNLTSNISNILSSTEPVQLGILNQMLTDINNYNNNMVNNTAQAYSQFTNVIRTEMTNAEQVLRSTISQMLTDITSQNSAFYSAGSGLMTSIKTGMESKKAEIESGASTLVNALKSKFEEGLGIHSPSRWGQWVGEMTVAGVEKGVVGGKLDQFIGMVLTDMQNSFNAGKFNPMELVENLGAGTLNLIGKLSQVDTSGMAAQTIAYPLIGTMGTQTSWFGYRPASDTGGIGTTNHGGVDLAAPTGTPIAAALGGNVTTAGWYGGYGNAVVIDSGNGIDITYGHMSQVLAQVGQNVAKGSQIGLVGSTGNSTGPHLHFEMHQNGSRIDPQPYIEGASVTAGSPLATAIQNAYASKMGLSGADSGNVSYDISAGAAQWTPQVLQALQMLGQPASLLQGVLYAIENESGGNPNALNDWDSNAAAGDPSRGLLQTIGSTFNAYRNPSLSANIYDPLANIYAGLNYMIQRYGSVDAVVTPRLGGWYGYAKGTDNADKGLHWVGENGPELIQFDGGERVYPHNESVKIAQGISENSSQPISITPQTNQSNKEVNVTFSNGAFQFTINASGSESIVPDIQRTLIEHSNEIALVFAREIAKISEGAAQNGGLA